MNLSTNQTKTQNQTPAKEGELMPENFMEDEETLPAKSFSIGQTFKNYKDLCVFLETPVKSGLAKRNHMAEIETCLSLKASGQSLTITSILKDPTPLFSYSKKLRPSFWEAHLSILILEKLQQTLDEPDSPYFNTLMLQPSEAFFDFGFSATPLTTIKYMGKSPKEQKILKGETSSFQTVLEKVKTGELSTESYFDSEKFYPSLSSKLWSDSQTTLKRVLERLSDKDIINHSYTFVLSTKASSSSLRPATFDELTCIKDAEALALKTLKLSSKHDMRSSPLEKAFYKIRSELLSKQGITFCQKVHLIGFTANLVANGATYKQELEAQLGAKYQINDRTFSNLVNFYTNQNSCPEVIKKIIRILEEVVRLPPSEDLPQPFQS